MRSTTDLWKERTMTRLRYRFSVLGRFLAADTDDINVTLAVVAGTGDEIAYSSTVTMPEWEWRAVIAEMERAGIDVKVEDTTPLARTA
jgi:hypothetical protein